VPIEVARTVVSWGATALLPVGPEVVTKVQGVSDLMHSVLMHSVGVLPTNVQVADKLDTSAFPVAAVAPSAAS
jgi:sulfonate transport system substrate-binding protein